MSVKAAHASSGNLSGARVPPCSPKSVATDEDGAMHDSSQIFPPSKHERPYTTNGSRLKPLRNFTLLALFRSRCVCGWGG